VPQRQRPRSRPPVPTSCCSPQLDDWLDEHAWYRLHKQVITSPDSDIAEDRVRASRAPTAEPLRAPESGFMQMVAFRSVPVQPPDCARNLTATAASSVEIDLGWTLVYEHPGIAGYRVERCPGAGCTSFTQIAAPTERPTRTGRARRTPPTAIASGQRTRQGI